MKNIIIDKKQLNILINFMIEESEINFNDINKLGNPEFRIVMNQDLKCYAHVLGRNSATVDFEFRNKTTKELRKEKLDNIDDKI